MKRHCSCDRCKKHHHKWDDCCKHDHKCCCKKGKKHDGKDKHKKRDKADLLDFEFFTLDPNVRMDNNMRLPEDMQTPVASVTLEQVRNGDLVWLNGVFGLDQDETIFIDNRVDMRIFKGNPPVFTPGSEIYRARFEVEGEAGDDQVIEPLMHVDRITENANNVTYTVTIEPLDTDLFLNGPITFTAALINKR
ncbi:MAG TPA: hypothetical protein VIG73_06505 [Cerasibacillus sp.]|uniref:hypothetical protein n=1 Tax=Cerasibacillus sp. TaxID=2498711 RepID=UPI002F42ED5C